MSADTLEIDNQYATGLSRHNIERALVTFGKDLNHMRPSDLGELEDFHTLGRMATRQLADLAEITSHDEVLDAGSGIGGTARFLADQYGCRVATIDLTEEYCDTAGWLNRLVGLDDRISVRQGDVTVLPFARASFDVVVSQHVQMNVADKGRLYQQARRVLHVGGRLAIWDIAVGTHGRARLPTSVGRPARTQPPRIRRPATDRHRNLRLRRRTLERPHRTGSVSHGDLPVCSSRRARIAHVHRQLRREGEEPHS